RSLASTLVLLIRHYECVSSARACPSALLLMYPSRTREPLSVFKTHNRCGLLESARSVPSGGSDVRASAGGCGEGAAGVEAPLATPARPAFIDGHDGYREGGERVCPPPARVR